VKPLFKAIAPADLGFVEQKHYGIIIGGKYTSCFISQLSTDNLSLLSVPEVITHCSPDGIVADLHTPASGIASLKSDGSLSTSRTTHSSILVVHTLAFSQVIGRAINEPGLISKALNIG
jgi:hypothetical protein